jgi:hypothetical protein
MKWTQEEDELSSNYCQGILIGFCFTFLGGGICFVLWVISMGNGS